MPVRIGIHFTQRSFALIPIVANFSRSSGLTSSLTRTFGYVDPSNRISTASEGSGWAQNYAYDQYGNRAVSGYMPNANMTPSALAQFTNNHWIRGAGDVYDSSGNQTGIASNNAPSLSSATMTYDAENRMITSNFAGTGLVNYEYDGDGRRVRKWWNCGAGCGTSTVYVYTAQGQLAAEYSVQPPVTPPGLEYLTADHLGSTRLVTDGNGSVVQCYDYLPFGEEIGPTLNGRSGCYSSSGLYPHPADATSRKFTGKERDAESGLDYFQTRYMSSAQGRFTSPDSYDITQEMRKEKIGTA